MDTVSTRDRLLDAAARVFVAHGYTGTSMELVRQEAGVSNGSLYHHFPAKADLADAVYGHTLRDFHASLLPAIAGRVSAHSGVKGLVRAYVHWVVDHPQSARLLHRLRRSGDLTDTASQRGQANAQAFAALREWVHGKTQGGEMREMPFTVWMALVFSPAMTLTQQWVQQEQPAVAPKVRAALEHGAWMAVAA
jgi:AcrR family transcriptional regulator